MCNRQRGVFCSHLFAVYSGYESGLVHFPLIPRESLRASYTIMGKL